MTGPRRNVDRTPKPCAHKVAEHQHGTRAAYVLDRCRCEPCTEANTAAERERRTQQVYGRYDKYVDAEPVREHIAMLSAYGIGYKQVARLTGLSGAVFTKLLYGTYAPAEGPQRGRYGAGDLVRGPSKRVLRTTAEKILAVQAVPQNRGAVGLDTDRTHVARAHLQALVALGWSMRGLGARLGVRPTNMRPIVMGDHTMTRRTVERIEALYGELSMTLPPAGNRFEQASVTRSKRLAAGRGWLPPLAIDEDDLTRYSTLTIDELLEEGLTLAQVGTVLGCAPEDVEDWLVRRGERERTAEYRARRAEAAHHEVTGGPFSRRIVECANCGRRRVNGGRGLCDSCRTRRNGCEPVDHERATWPAAELVEEYERLRLDGYTRRQAAERLHITKDRLDKAIERTNRRRAA